jgi:hypothetical protein
MLCASVIAAGLTVALGITPTLSQTKQEHIHEMGQSVMPFDLNTTMHTFRMTDTGGVQKCRGQERARQEMDWPHPATSPT